MRFYIQIGSLVVMLIGLLWMGIDALMLTIKYWSEPITSEMRWQQSGPWPFALLIFGVVVKLLSNEKDEDE